MRDYTTHTTITLPTTLRIALEKLAIDKRMGFSAYVRYILADHVIMKTNPFSPDQKPEGHAND